MGGEDEVISSITGNVRVLADMVDDCSADKRLALKLEAEEKED